MVIFISNIKRINEVVEYSTLDTFPMIVPASAVRLSDCHYAVTTDHAEWEYDNLRHVEMKVSQIFIFEMCLIIQFLSAAGSDEVTPL